MSRPRTIIAPQGFGQPYSARLGSLSEDHSPSIPNVVIGYYGTSKSSPRDASWCNIFGHPELRRGHLFRLSDASKLTFERPGSRTSCTYFNDEDQLRLDVFEFNAERNTEILDKPTADTLLLGYMYPNQPNGSPQSHSTTHKLPHPRLRQEESVDRVAIVSDIVVGAFLSAAEWAPHTARRHFTHRWVVHAIAQLSRVGYGLKITPLAWETIVEGLEIVEIRIANARRKTKLILEGRSEDEERSILARGVASLRLDSTKRANM